METEGLKMEKQFSEKEIPVSLKDEKKVLMISIMVRELQIKAMECFYLSDYYILKSLILPYERMSLMRSHGKNKLIQPLGRQTRQFQ